MENELDIESMIKTLIAPDELSKEALHEGVVVVNFYRFKSNGKDFYLSYYPFQYSEPIIDNCFLNIFDEMINIGNYAGDVNYIFSILEPYGLPQNTVL